MMLQIAIVEQLVVAFLGLLPQVPEGVSIFAKSLTSQLPALVAAGTDIETFIEQQIALIKNMVSENRDPTDLEWDSLNTAVEDEHNKLQNGD